MMITARFYFVSVLMIFFAMNAFSQEDPDNHLALGDDMPVFNYQSEDGKTLSSEDLWGKVVLVNFYASWCGPCKRELPHVDKDIWQIYRNNKDFALLIFARQEDWDKIKGFRESTGLELPYHPDPKREIYNLFADKYIPRNYLFDKQGRLVLYSRGFLMEEFEDLKKEIKSLLED